MDTNIQKDRIRGSLVGGAIGDAFGYPVKDISLYGIRQKYGDGGLTKYELNKNGVAIISDDTQLSLFTANGLLYGVTRFAMRGIGADLHNYVREAYIDWFRTQNQDVDDEKYHPCWLRNILALNENRSACDISLHALYPSQQGGRISGIIDKGYGAVTRVAPVGLFAASAEVLHNNKWKEGRVFQLATECAKITHLHPMAWLSAGVFAHIVYELAKRDSEMRIERDEFEHIVGTACHYMIAFSQEEGNYAHQLHEKLITALELARTDVRDMEITAKLGVGIEGDEVLAIAVYCASKHINSFEDAIIAAANQDGLSDSICSVCGNIMGAVWGYDLVPEYYKKHLELREVILDMADDLANGCCVSEYGANNKPEQLKWLARYVYAYPWGFSHLPMKKIELWYHIPGQYGEPEKMWPEVDQLLKENVPEFFFFNEANPKSGSEQEAMLSIWYRCQTNIENTEYWCVGQYMQAEKARIFGDLDTRKKILISTSKHEILTLGKKVKGYDERRWRNLNYAVSLFGNYHKFIQNEDCKQALTDTGDKILVKDSSYDADWGVGHTRDDERIFNPDNWVGVNLLGFVLMVVRDTLRMHQNSTIDTWNCHYIIPDEVQQHMDSLPTWKEKLDYKIQMITEKIIYYQEMSTCTESGTFTCCDGSIIAFEPNEDNIIGERDGRIVLQHLILPSDKSYTRRIADGVFRDIEVEGNVQLTCYLEEIGDFAHDHGAFVNCKFNKLYIPFSVRKIGIFSFAKCKINVLKMHPNNLTSEYGRQFKGSFINKLYLPETSIEDKTKYGIIHSLAANADIKEVFLDHFVRMTWKEYIEKL